MENREKLRDLLIDLLLLDDEEFSFDLTRDEVDTWDSLGVVAIAAGVEEIFGYHLTPDQATGVTGVPDLVRILEQHGIVFDGA